VGPRRPSAAAAGGTRSWAALGRKRSGPLGARCDGKPGGGAEGLPPDLDRWAAQKEQGRKGRVFLILKQRIQTRFKHKFEFNQPKINAPACMQQ
jgi:hypothetical protein